MGGAPLTPSPPALWAFNGRGRSLKGKRESLSGGERVLGRCSVTPCPNRWLVENETRCWECSQTPLPASQRASQPAPNNGGWGGARRGGKLAKTQAATATILLRELLFQETLPGGHSVLVYNVRGLGEQC